MTASIAYANLFAQAGLIDEISSRFRSISDPQALYNFILQWMESYGQVYEKHSVIQLLKGFKLAKMIQPGNDIFEEMMERVTRDYGDPTFPSRFTSPDNRVPAMNQTELHIQATFYPTIRVKGGLGLWKDSVSYVGPADSENVYTTPLPFQYAIKNNRTFFYLAVEDTSLPLRTCLTDAPKWYSKEDWERLSFYPGDPQKDSVLLSLAQLPPCKERGVLSDFFGGQTLTAMQAVVAGSDIFSPLSSLAPASFAQSLSVLRHAAVVSASSSGFLGQWLAGAVVDTAAASLYKLADRYVDFGTCSQYPNPCGVSDATIGDGTYTDDTTLGLHIGQYQSIDNGDKSKTLKAILSLHNLPDHNLTYATCYFNTTFNEGIEPGGYAWAPGFSVDGVFPNANPWRSPQIFEEFWDQESLEAMFVPSSDDVGVSTARITATTIDNPAFHVQAGQKVELLFLLTTSYEIPTLVILDDVEQYKEQFAEMARDIAGSADLLQVVNDFVSSSS